MGLSLFSKCSTNYTPTAPAPNPNPGRWTLLDWWEYKRGYVLKVRYPDATNYEGVKIMVYRGKFPGEGKLTTLDPHFRPGSDSPIARFRPDSDGVHMAMKLAREL